MTEEWKRMIQKTMTVLQQRLTEENYQKLLAISNPEVHCFIAKYVELCNPSRIFVCTDSREDIAYTRKAACRNKEEALLAIKGHTVHFDGYYDQARDKENTKFLVSDSYKLGPGLNTLQKEEGLREIKSIMKNIMTGHELFIKFYCLGPQQSPFSIPCVQLTDSAYVAHSEDLLYRQGYQEFLRMKKDAFFFKFVHSEGVLERAGLGLLVSKQRDKRRIYIDLQDEIIYSVNTQYGGNTIGLKKLAMRLSIHRASKEGWLTEHMLLMGIKGPQGRITYFTGAFPSMCGKTSTAMVEGETIVGDDIAFLRTINRRVRAVNVEKGLFGIIEGINAKDDPLQWKALHSPIEIIFSNILVTKDNHVYWNGKDTNPPKTGVNHSGEWYQGKTDDAGNEIPPSHKNARFTIDLSILDNLDPNLHDPNGVEVKGIIYGGRDSDTWVPVEEAFDWIHGIITKGASLESETTAATLGKVGIRMFNPMSNIDFLSIPIGQYVEGNLKFGKTVPHQPHIFSVNYFLKDTNGQYLNHKNDKMVWLKWMERRVHNDVDAIAVPTGKIPLYTDLQNLFQAILHKKYSPKDYTAQFTIRIPENLEKIERILKIYKVVAPNIPKVVHATFQQQRARLEKAQETYGEYISPDSFLESKL